MRSNDSRKRGAGSNLVELSSAAEGRESKVTVTAPDFEAGSGSDSLLHPHRTEQRRSCRRAPTFPLQGSLKSDFTLQPFWYLNDLRQRSEATPE